jgi:hypothetical protein
MTNSVWISIATIVVQSAVAFFAAYWQVKTAREIASPSQKIPKEKTNRTGNAFLYWFRNRLIPTAQSPWYFPGLVILVNICALRWNVRSASPITRRVVYDISSSVAGILYGLILMIVNLHAQSTRKAIKMLLEPIRVLSEGFRTTSEFVGTLSKDVKDMRTTVQSSALIKQLQDLTTQLQVLQTKIGQPKQKRFRKGS